MTSPLHIKDTLGNKVTYYHLLGFLVMLPSDRFYSQLVLISLVLHSIISIRKSQLQRLYRKETVILQSVFFLTVICTAWSVYRTNAFGIWEKQLAMFLFPVVLLLTDLNLKNCRQQLLTGFAFVCTAVVIWLYVDAFRIMVYYNFEPQKLFTPFFLNHNFSKPIALHATYLSLYIAISIFALLTFLFNEKHSRTNRMLYLSCILVLSAGLLQLASRSVLISVLLVVNCILPWFCHSRKQKIRFICGSLLVSAIVLFCIIRTDSLNLRLVQGFKDDVNASSLKFSAADPRGQRWQLVIGLIKQSPVVGYGTGSEIPILKEEWFRHKFYDSYLNELNAHNQYLSFLLKGGLIALIVYIFTLFFCFRLAIRKKDPLFIGFLVLITVVGLSENIMDVNKGIFFYAFFLSVFVCSHLETGSNSIKENIAGNQRQALHVFLYKNKSHKTDPWQ
jgi:O-antigen ligase